MAKLTDKAKVDIIYRYKNTLSTMIELAEEYQVTRQSIHKFLKKAGVKIDKGPILVTCNACHKEILRYKFLIRKNHRNFCNQECYTAFLQAGYGFGKLVNNHQGTRIARTIVSQYFKLLPGYVVHHKDRNNLNNVPSNLMVFRNQGDHVRWHRGLILEVDPLWDGSNL